MRQATVDSRQLTIQSRQPPPAFPRNLGGADLPFFGMSAPLERQRGAYIPTTSVGTYAPTTVGLPATVERALLPRTLRILFTEPLSRLLPKRMHKLHRLFRICVCSIPPEGQPGTWRNSFTGLAQLCGVCSGSTQRRASLCVGLGRGGSRTARTGTPWRAPTQEAKPSRQ